MYLYIQRVMKYTSFGTGTKPTMSPISPAAWAQSGPWRSRHLHTLWGRQGGRHGQYPLELSQRDPN